MHRCGRKPLTQLNLQQLRLLFFFEGAGAYKYIIYQKESQPIVHRQP